MTSTCSPSSSAMIRSVRLYPSRIFGEAQICTCYFISLRTYMLHLMPSDVHVASYAFGHTCCILSFRKCMCMLNISTNIQRTSSQRLQNAHALTHTNTTTTGQFLSSNWRIYTTALRCGARSCGVYALADCQQGRRLWR